jgi:ribonuclease HI
MLKLKFDEATKGNPGPTRVGGVLWNAYEDILGLYWGHIGENMNNAVELKALLAGINMVVTNRWFPVIIEGDSQIILQMAMNLLHGKLVNKVADNWRLAYNLEQLRSIPIAQSEVHTQHVKRKANKLADILANHGVDSGQDLT